MAYKNRVDITRYALCTIFLAHGERVDTSTVPNTVLTRLEVIVEGGAVRPDIILPSSVESKSIHRVRVDMVHHEI